MNSRYNNNSVYNSELEEFVTFIKANRVEFIVLDVETANTDTSTVCQIGLAAFSNDAFIKSWGVYINPEDYFDYRNIAVHGIVEADVKSAPLFLDIYKGLQLLSGFLIVQHTSFDQKALDTLCEKLDVDKLDYRWLDSALIVKRTWREVSKKGFGLGNLSSKFGFTFQHHDAVEDATVTGKIVNKACEDSGNSIHDWIELVKKPLNYFYKDLE